MRKFKFIFLLILLIISSTIIVTTINTTKTEKVSIKGNDRTVYTTAPNTSKEKTYIEGKVTKENCSYELTGDGKLIIYNYIEDVDSVIVEGDIDGHPIDDIDTKTFSHCENLEIIKVSNDIKNTQKIENFEKNDILSNDQYTVYLTTKEYNSDYIKFLSLSKEQRQKIGEAPKKFIVSVRNVDLEKDDDITVKADEIPTSYCMTTQNVISHTFQKYGNIKINVEYQGEFPLCSSYAGMKSFETYISLNFPDKKSNPENFSELHFRFMMSRGKQYDNAFETAYLYGDGTVVPNNLYNGRYIKEPVGPVDESVLSYKEASTWKNDSDERKRNIYKFLMGNYDANAYTASLSQSQLDAAYNLIHTGNDVPKYYVMGCVGFNSISGDDKRNTDSKVQQNIAETRKKIKQHIMKNGSLRTYVRGIKNTQYIQDDKITTNKMLTFYRKNAPSNTEDSHAVSIVGWDDNFSKDNFTGLANKPEHDGAYLAVNSWGTNWGPQNGYFWISYDDYTVEYVLEGVTDIRNTKADVTEMSIDMYSQTKYTGNAVKPQITCKFSNDGPELEEHLDYEIVDNNSNHQDAGTNKVTVKGIGRFQGERELEYEIQPRELVVTADSKSKNANDQDPEFTYKYTGAVGSQVPKFTGKLQRQSGENAGTYEITQGTLTLEDNPSTGFKASNYKIKFVSGKLTVTENTNLEVKFSNCEVMSKNGKQYLTGAQEKTTLQEFKKGITTNGTIKIYKDDKEKTIDSKNILETGMKIKIELNSKKQEFIAIVAGDANGDGKADLNDILKINKHRLKKALLENEYLLAGDVNQDNKADLNDILRINKYRLKKIEQL